MFEFLHMTPAAFDAILREGKPRLRLLNHRGLLKWFCESRGYIGSRYTQRGAYTRWANAVTNMRLDLHPMARAMLKRAQQDTLDKRRRDAFADYLLRTGRK